MKFYCVIRSLNDPRMPRKCFNLLENACKQRGLEFIAIESKNFDYTNVPKLGNSDILFKLTTDNTSGNAMATMLTKDVSTIYINNLQGSTRFTSDGWSKNIALRLNDVPIIPTITSIPKDKDLLKKYVDHLGGFPIIIKSQGGSHGVGVMRIDSLESLASVADYLLSNTFGEVGLKKYIDFKTHGRLVVVADKVIDSIEYRRPNEDFRTNVGAGLVVRPQKFDQKIEEAAVKATKAVGYEFGGVDVLIDANGQDFYVAEVNTPCNFARAQNTTGTDIAGALVDHLIAKAESR